MGKLVRLKDNKGIICGILAAVFYGTNPLGALPLYAEGVNTSSVLFYRFSVAAAILGILLVLKRKPLGVTLHEFKVLMTLGVMFAVSSITYYLSFRYMDAGIASTILFVYPVLVAVIMSIFFKEKVTKSTISSIILSLAGIALLYRGGEGATLSTVGIVLVLMSSLSYALYIIYVNQSSIRMSSLKLTFYVLISCMLTLLLFSFTSPDLHLQFPPSPRAWFFACWLGVVPTILSLVLMTIAVHEVGATPTAIMGALEPLTAVAVGVLVFGESFSLRLAVGIVLILMAVVIIVVGKNFHFRTIGHRLSKLLRKTWRWKS
ncbi:MAG: DMT family transporter [Bacteroidaceae bacterium]|nr:DMT family transporter [Bacteroidaceae bacterium]